MPNGLRLFRQEAVEFQLSHRQWGEAVLLQPPSMKVMTWLAVAAVGALVAFVWFAPYSRKETVSGFLTPLAGTARVMAPRQGVVKNVHVAEGQTVDEGQPLLTIATDEIAAGGEDLNAAMLETLARQRALLTQQVKAEGERTRAEEQRLRAVIKGLETEITQLRNQSSIQSERIRLADSLLAPATQLRNKGYMSDVDHAQREEALLQQRQSLNALQQQVAAREIQLADARNALSQAPVSVAEKIQLLRNELAATEQRAAEIKGRNSYVIRAPISGRVTTLQATPGQVADPRLLQMTITPSEGQLSAELFVPTRAIGFIQPGQEVRVLYDAFPYQSFGAYHARTTKVTETILSPSDISVPVQLKEPVYRVTAALDRPDVDAYGRKVPLQAGMLLKADIILERRSIMQWLLDPLLSARS